jgi:hypothetical protein
MASESSNFTSATWKTYSTAPNFTLSSGNATKTVYFKVKNVGGESTVSSDTIILNIVIIPTISSFKINNGAASTSNAVVTLNNICGNSPTQYMASESSSFTGATWQTWSSAPNFTLSSGIGTKTIYFKVMNTAGGSATVSDTITFNEVLIPAVTAFTINNGADTATTRTVTLNNTCTNTPTEYMASESMDFTGGAWKAWSSAPIFTLSVTNGLKAVYFKVRNAGGESSAVSHSITLKMPPSISSFRINNGATYTTNTIVTLNNVCVNTPTHYMASESSNFSGASWQIWSATPKFTLSLGYGKKTIYFKVKNSEGESPVASDTIIPYKPCSVGKAWMLFE